MENEWYSLQCSERVCVVVVGSVKKTTPFDDAGRALNQSIRDSRTSK